MAVEAGDPEASTAEEKRGDGGAEGGERDFRVGDGRELGEELGVEGDGAVAELGASRRRIAWWRRSAVEVGDLEASAAKEKK